jgi:transposase
MWVLADLFERVLTTQTRGDSLASIADALALKVSTVRSIVRKYTATGEVQRSEKKGGRPKKISPEIAKFLCDKLDEDCTKSLGELVAMVGAEYDVQVSEVTVSRAVRDFHYTMKAVQLRSERVLDEDVVSQRVR